jgi:hypothetical protein
LGWLTLVVANLLLAVLGGMFLDLRGHSVAWVYFGIGYAVIMGIGMLLLWWFRPARGIRPR